MGVRALARYARARTATGHTNCSAPTPFTSGPWPRLSYRVGGGGAASGSEHTYCRSSSQLCSPCSSVAWKSTSVVLRVKESRERRSGSVEVSRKT